MAEVQYAVVLDGVVAFVESRFDVACGKASAARRDGSKVVVRRATPDEIRRFSGLSLDDVSPQNADDDWDDDIPF